ncbi:hypothetical protein Goshw_022700 [Gossypium schwendimanii]|uniref:Calmodulin-binding protein n=2 Tax=Gossypium TaxID=3633 RepID=A0A7J9N2Y0_GOSSC|nr:hypothetical protein [Gossypium schwendimanii]
MDMEVVVPVPLDFNFDSACSSPYMTAPSTPQRFGNGSSFFFSAPTSPTRASSSVAVPFEWEEKPGFPKMNDFNGGIEKEDNTHGGGGEGCEDFEFDFSGQLERTSLSAEELFDGGKIRPLKPPPGFSELSSYSPKSPRSFRKKDIDPFETAIEKSRRRSAVEPKITTQRGRETTSSSSSSYVHKKSRSLSPFRVSDHTMFEQDQTTASSTNPKSYMSSILSAISFSKGNRKWKLKDLLLFRSASEGRATSKDSFKKYAVLSKKEAEDVKSWSFRSTESVGSSSKRRGPVSAHELHYTANRAVSEEMRRKTFLPYKQGLLGCLGFNPGIHEVSRGIMSFTRG